jgi:hypothetical protein
MNPWSVLPFLKTVNYTVSMDALGASKGNSPRAELALDLEGAKEHAGLRGNPAFTGRNG